MARSRTVEMTSGLGGPGAVVTLVSAPIASYGPCVRHVQTGCTSAWSASVSSLAMNTASPPPPPFLSLPRYSLNTATSGSAATVTRSNRCM